jgi:hypothetical protein
MGKIDLFIRGRSPLVDFGRVHAAKILPQSRYFVEALLLGRGYVHHVSHCKLQGMSNIPFVCKNCGGETFRVPSKPKSLDDFEGAACENCGTKLTKKDIEDQARNVAVDALKKAGFKIK